MQELSGKLPGDAASVAGSNASNGTAKDATVTRTNTGNSSDISNEKETLDEGKPKDIESGVSPEQTVLSGKKMVGVMVALALSMFLAALDNTIVSTMLPKITEKFQALTLMTWIISSY
ncbi:hypothetical protein IWW50_005471, partial [Coemansia erecta]